MQRSDSFHGFGYTFWNYWIIALHLLNKLWILHILVTSITEETCMVEMCILCRKIGKINVITIMAFTFILKLNEEVSYTVHSSTKTCAPIRKYIIKNFGCLRCDWSMVSCDYRMLDADPQHPPSCWIHLDPNHNFCSPQFSLFSVETKRHEFRCKS